MPLLFHQRMIIKFSRANIYILDHLILQNVTFKIYSETFCRICGSNGSGKTVLLNSILGLNQHVEGNHNLNFRKQDVCYISDSPFFLDDERVGEVIKTIMFFYRCTETEVINILEILELDYKKIKEQFIYQLSKGMQKKLMLIPIFLNKYKLLVIDEVFTGLDSKIQNLLIEKLNSLYHEKITVIFVEHNESISNRILENKTRCLTLQCINKTVV